MLPSNMKNTGVLIASSRARPGSMDGDTRCSDLCVSLNQLFRDFIAPHTPWSAVDATLVSLESVYWAAYVTDIQLSYGCSHEDRDS